MGRDLSRAGLEVLHSEERTCSSRRQTEEGSLAVARREEEPGAGRAICELAEGPELRDQGNGRGNGDPLVCACPLDSLAQTCEEGRLTHPASQSSHDVLGSHLRSNIPAKPFVPLWILSGSALSQVAV